MLNYFTGANKIYIACDYTDQMAWHGSSSSSLN